MPKGNGFQYKLSKRPGAALLGVVLVSLILLGIFSAVAFNIAMNTMRVERWQREHFEQQQMQYLARSAVIQTGYKLKKDAVNASYSKAFDSKGSMNIIDTDRFISASLDFVLSADSGAPTVLIKVTAYSPGSPLSADTKAVISGRYVKSTGRMSAWEEDD